jgi:hypothetical protein
MVHFPGFARARLWIHRAVRGFYPRGFPHSEIPGSKPACGSPRLIAACHVLHRLLLPRHPPCALSSLTTKFTQHTQRSLQLSAISLQPKTNSNTPLKFYGPLILLLARSRFRRVASCPLWFKLLTCSTQHRSRRNRHVHQQVFQALIKIYVRLVIYPIYSVVKYRPRQPKLT